MAEGCEATIMAPRMVEESNVSGDKRGGGGLVAARYLRGIGDNNILLQFSSSSFTRAAILPPSRVEHRSLDVVDSSSREGQEGGGAFGIIPRNIHFPIQPLVDEVV